MDTIEVVRESPRSHKGTAVIDGEHYTFSGWDVSPYSEYDIYSVKRYTVKGHEGRLTARLRSTYLYKDNDLLLTDMTDKVRYYKDKLMKEMEDE